MKLRDSTVFDIDTHPLQSPSAGVLDTLHTNCRSGNINIGNL